MDVSLLSQLRQVACVACAATLLGCGGGDTGNVRDSGPEKTYLRVEASDAEGDALSYQWRATAGAIENRNSPDTVWTLPPGPGLHFAYVTVSDGRGGYVEQQYAVSSDALARGSDPRPPIQRVIGRFDGFDGGTGRLRFRLRERLFVPAGGGTSVERMIDLPSVRVQLRNAGNVVFSGASDESGEVQLPQFAPGTQLTIHCATSGSEILQDCKASFLPSATEAPTRTVDLTTIVPAGSNLRLHGHVGLSDGGTCGVRNDFAGLRSAGTVQVVDTSGAPLTPEVSINRHGDYAIDAAVRVDAALRLRVRCDALMREVDIPNPGGFTGTPLELSTTLQNSRPRIVKMVANGPEGNVRGRMIVAEADVSSNTLPGAYRFLAYKGADTRLGACLYYKAFGAAEACDAQGNMSAPLTLEDWKRKHQLQPYAGSNTEVRATYINKMDLNLVRRMVATKTSNDNIAFYVCNHPGPDGTSQQEVNQVIDTGQRNERLVACVAMEWSVTPGVNGDKPFTKFLTFGPDGSLLPSVNLDGRGEKFMPGACVACHGGTQYSGKFPDQLNGKPSPNLGSAFLTFDTANFLFSDSGGARKEDQQAAFKALNELVRDTERDYAESAIRNLVDGWYAGNRTTLNERFVPADWLLLDSTRPGAAEFYREVVGSACRTCHAALKGFDWDTAAGIARIVVPAGSGDRNEHVCGGSPDLAVNASMPNALISRDRVLQRVQANSTLNTLMQDFFGCTEPLPDPAYARR